MCFFLNALIRTTISSKVEAALKLHKYLYLWYWSANDKESQVVFS